MSGRVIEVGAGAGSNFAHYPATVEDVMAVEPEPYLRERSRRRRHQQHGGELILFPAHSEEHSLQRSTRSWEGLGR